MAPFRNRDRSNRSGRGQIEHNVLEGLPITQFREAEITIEPHSADNKPLDKDAWPELPMPRDSHMLPEHSQQLLREARSGKLYKPPAPPEDDNEMKDEEEESKEIRTGFTIKKYVKVARHLEVSEPEYLAKRRKGLPSPYISTQVAQPALRETKVKKLDAEGNVAVYKVLVPEGQAVEGEVQPTDAAIEVAPATAAPGTVVEGVGVVNAEGIVVANDIMQQTPPRRRPPPPKKKVKRGGPGRGKKKVVFAEGATEQGTPASTAGGDMLEVPGVKREDGSVAPSDGGDTPMADAGGEDEEGSGEEGSEDEDHDMERTSTPATPLRSSIAPPSAGAMDISDPPVTAPAEVVADSSADIQMETPADAPVEATIETTTETTQPLTMTTNEPPQNTREVDKTTVESTAPETAQEPVKRDTSSSPDLPLSTMSHSRQNSLNQIPTSATSTENAVPEDIPSEVPAPTVEADAAPASTVASEPEPAPEPAPVPTSESVPEPVTESAPEPVQDSAPEIPFEPVQETAQDTAQETAPEPKQNSEPVPEPEPVQPPSAVPSAPTSEPDLMGSLEKQLEKDNNEVTEP